MSYTIKTTCRACDSTELKPVFDLGVQPLANDHVKPNHPRQGFYPLAVNRCERCGQAQLSVVVAKEQLYSNYSYVTSRSETMRRHFERLFQDIISEGVERTIVEIGSNDGTLLSFANNKLAFSVLGIEPAQNLAALANDCGVTTFASFIDSPTAVGVAKEMPYPGVILARHCFAHIDDWHEFFAMINVMAGKNTLVCIEVPYVKDMLDRVEFDTVYNEHLSFISLKPLAHLLKATPFHIHRVIRYGIHGGALLLMLRHDDSPVQPHLSADEHLAEEEITVKEWELFNVNAHGKIAALREDVCRLISKGKIVSAFGASAKATVLINACRFTSKEIAFVTDNSPLKPGCLLPGTDIPIIEEGEMLSHHPDYSVLTAWNFELEILAKMDKWRKRGGKFIVPDQQLRIV